jgi:hypothetical protein
MNLTLVASLFPEAGGCAYCTGAEPIATKGSGTSRQIFLEEKIDKMLRHILSAGREAVAVSSSEECVLLRRVAPSLCTRRSFASQKEQEQGE